MKLVVDLTRCQGYAQCAFLAPDAFTMHGDGEALLYDPEPSDELRERVLRAAAACPVQAIVLDRGPVEDGSQRAAAAAARRGDMDEEFLRTGRIVIVGASLAGTRAAGALRYQGFTSSLTVICDESAEPYDRPPLSKQVLDGWVPAGHTGLPRRGAIEADWRLGVAATGLDLAAKQVRLADGSSVGFDRLLITTGVRARPWPNPDEAALTGCSCCAPARTPTGCGDCSPGGRTGCWSSAPGSPARRSPPSAASSTCRSPWPRPARLRSWPPWAARSARSRRTCTARPASTCAAASWSPRWRARTAVCAAPGSPTAALWTWTWRSLRSAASATSSGWKAPGWRPARGAWPATPAVAPSTPTAWSPTTSSSPATSPAPRNRCSVTSCSPSSTGATRSPRPRSPPTT